MTRESKAPNNKFNFQKGDAILTVLFFTSIGLTIWGINIYRQTIIDIKYLLFPIVIGIIISFAILTWQIKSNYSTIWSFLIKAVIGGGLFYFCFLFINQQFANKAFLTEQFPIVKKGTLRRGNSNSCIQPYVNIGFYGTEKQLIFFCDYADAVKHSTKVNLTYSKGAFGFKIIKSKQLAE